MGGIFSFISKFLFGGGAPQDQPQLNVHGGPQAGDQLEELVAQVSEVLPGQMKEVNLGEGKVLLCRNHDGEFSAIGTKCTHYGAPLKSGAFEGSRVRCPWHGACFNTKTGDIEDHPAMDGLPVFDVRVDGENVYVKGDPEEVRTSKRTGRMCASASTDDRLFVIIGGGAAGASCAQTLRQANFTGRILVIGKENVYPYDRPKLSKSMTVALDTILLRPATFWEKHNVEFLLGKTVTELDASTKTITLDDGNRIQYHSCLVATGGTPRGLPVTPVVNYSNVFLLRDFEQAGAIDAASAGKDVVIIGSSFIGMETAAAIASKAKSVTVIGMEKVPFERVLGLEVGTALQKLHESNKIQFRMESMLGSVKTDGDRVTAVILKSGEEISCDMIAVGAGVIPTTSFIKGVELAQPDKSIICDVYMKAADGLYAAGDIARFPLKMLDNHMVRIEHWGMAQKQGAIAAWNMAGKATPIDSVPVFWTAMYGKTVRYCGHGLQYNEVIFDKAEDGLTPAAIKFVAFYSNKDQIVAVASLGRDPIVALCSELMHAGTMPTGDKIKEAIARDGSCDALLKSSLLK